MRLAFEINGTRFEAVADPRALAFDHGEDMLGDCEFRFDGETARELATVTLEEYTRGGHRIRNTLGERMEDRTGEAWEDGESLRLEADGGIAALCYLADRGNEDGEPWRFEWDGSGSAFWLFHDVTHAAEDFSADAGGLEVYGPPAELTAYEEDRANVEGAKLAKAAGIDAAEIAAELAGLGSAFRERFGQDSEALSDLLASGELIDDTSEHSRTAYREHVQSIAEQCAEHTDEDEEPDAWEHVPEDLGGWPAWAILTHSDHDGEELSETLDGRAFYALQADATERARELLTCDECGDRKRIDATTCEDCAS